VINTCFTSSPACFLLERISLMKVSSPVFEPTFKRHYDLALKIPKGEEAWLRGLSADRRLKTA
jgi:hypothetical protein